MEQEIEFTLNEGLAIQAQHLKQWRHVLKPSVYRELKKWADDNTRYATTGYDVCRGQTLNSFVFNYAAGVNINNLNQ